MNLLKQVFTKFEPQPSWSGFSFDTQVALCKITVKLSRDEGAFEHMISGTLFS